MTTVLLLDNRDSFTFNLAQALGELGATVEVVRATATDAAAVRAAAPDGVLIGPGPGTPELAGCSEEVLRDASLGVPVLGVCLGHQALASAFGGTWSRSRELVHGATRAVTHDGMGVWAGLPDPVEIARYNSLVVDRQTLPDALEVSATDAAGEVFGLRHRERPLEGLQGHPESVLCVEPHGRRLLANWLARCAPVSA